jgi:tyrosyl-tRNA synthetase
MVSADLPTVLVAKAELAAGIGVLAAFVKAGLAASNSEAKRAVANNALSVNDVRVADDKARLSGADLKDGAIKLSHGKKRHVLLRVE